MRGLRESVRATNERVLPGVSPSRYDNIFMMAIPMERIPKPARVPSVVIVGGGFGGLNAARALAGASVRVTLVDRHNYHLFQPLLYQVATASLSPGDVASPIRWILRHQANVDVLLAQVSAIDAAARRVMI